MKKSRERFFKVALECAVRILPFLTAWIIARLRG